MIEVMTINYAERMREFLFNYMDEEPLQLFDLRALKDDRGDCSSYPFGYVSDGWRAPSPCIFLKLNKIWGWEPSGTLDEDGRYDSSVSWWIDGKFDGNHDYYPEDYFPEVVLEKYLALPDTNKHDIIVNCEGRNAADKEALTDIKYFPKSQALPAKFFPFKPGGHTPLVAVKIELSPAHIGQLVHVECRAYYYGVQHSSKDRIGLVQFELLITE